jgi:hypothetical protein
MAIPQLTWIHYWNGSLLLPGVVCVLCVCTWHQREYTPGDLSQPLKCCTVLYGNEKQVKIKITTKNTAQEFIKLLQSKRSPIKDKASGTKIDRYIARVEAALRNGRPK